MPPTPKTPTQNPLATGDQLLTVAEVASFLRVSQATVLDLCKLGRLEYHGIGAGGKRRCYRIAQSALNEYLKNTRCNAPRELLAGPEKEKAVTARPGKRSGETGFRMLRRFGWDSGRVN